MGWIMPEGASTYAGDIDRLYYIILVITGIALLIVEVALVVFAIKYRARPGRRAHYTHGNMKAEVIWTAVPAVVVVMIGVLSARVWGEIHRKDGPPPDAIPVGVMAKQFEWNASYPGPDGQLGSADDVVTRNELHIPVSRPISVMLEAEDVIHSFFIPAFRVKQDAVPGMHIRIWFEATKPGTYELGCAELCGLGHYRMRGLVTVHEQADYDRWLAQQRPAAASNR
jgi:cytochrome c oxidase subunit 2